MKKLLVLAVVVGFVGCSRAAPGGTPGDSAAPLITTEGSMGLTVADLRVAEGKLGELITVRGGTVASMQTEAQKAMWTVRVPADRFRETITAVSALGNVSVVSTSARDVTGEVYDGEARLNAKQREETRLLRLLDTSAANLAEVLAVEKELSRVRGEIEELVGRKKVLELITETSALTVMMTEESAFVAASFGGQLGSTVTGSAAALVKTVKALVVIAAALIPWLLFGAMLVLPVIGVVRRQRSRRPA